jgi:hypothetical protein
MDGAGESCEMKLQDIDSKQLVRTQATKFARWEDPTKMRNNMAEGLKGLVAAQTLCSLVTICLGI